MIRILLLIAGWCLLFLGRCSFKSVNAFTLKFPKNTKFPSFFHPQRFPDRCNQVQIFSSNVCLKESKEGEFVEAEDLLAIQSLFNKYCDKDGLMTKAALEKVPAFAEMLVCIFVICGGHTMRPSASDDFTKTALELLRDNAGES